MVLPSEEHSINILILLEQQPLVNSNATEITWKREKMCCVLLFYYLNLFTLGLLHCFTVWIMLNFLFAA